MKMALVMFTASGVARSAIASDFAKVEVFKDGACSASKSSDRYTLGYIPLGVCTARDESLSECPVSDNAHSKFVCEDGILKETCYSDGECGTLARASSFSKLERSTQCRELGSDPDWRDVKQGYTSASVTCNVDVPSVVIGIYSDSGCSQEIGRRVQAVEQCYGEGEESRKDQCFNHGDKKGVIITQHVGAQCQNTGEGLPVIPFKGGYSFDVCTDPMQSKCVDWSYEDTPRFEKLADGCDAEGMPAYCGLSFASGERASYLLMAIGIASLARSRTD